MNNHDPSRGSAGRPAENPLAGRHILLLEDEMMVVMLVQDMLEEAGSTVTPANSIEKALALLESEQFDAAILDVNLAGKESYPVADALASRGTPFLFATGYSQEGVRPGYRGMGILPKPYRSETLVEMMRSLLAAPTQGA